MTSTPVGPDTVPDSTPDRRGASIGLTLRPRRTLLRDGTMATLALSLPILGALFWININGTWVPVLIVALILLVIVLGSFLGLKNTGVWVRKGQLVERGFFGQTRRIPLGRVADSVAIMTDSDLGKESADQLFVRDATGHLLLRMRGQFWTRDSMLTLCFALGVPMRRIEDPQDGLDFMAENQHLLYWFERKPALAQAIAVAVAAISVAIAIVLLLTYAPLGG